eukprot:815613-Rhodomonas_salina.1
MEKKMTGTEGGTSGEERRSRDAGSTRSRGHVGGRAARDYPRGQVKGGGGGRKREGGREGGKREGGRKRRRRE